MPQARKHRDRVWQCTQWLQVTFPCEYPVTVKWRKYCAGFDGKDKKRITKYRREMGIHGWCWRDGKKFTITLSSRKCDKTEVAIEVLVHEWAHAMTAKFAKMERRRLSEHDDEFFLAWGRIYRAWDEGGGSEAADKYEF